jgi:DNA-directed RNA polymerase subunit RPC12/RpoP
MSVTILFFVIAAVAMLAMIYRMVQSTKREQAPAHHYFRCLECGQKMRYSASRAGREASCPRCRHRWTLPATPQPLAKQDVAAETSGRGRGLVLRKSVRA